MDVHYFIACLNPFTIYSLEILSCRERMAQTFDRRCDVPDLCSLAPVFMNFSPSRYVDRLVAPETSDSTCLL